jgi:hypothetical protein
MHRYSVAPVSIAGDDRLTIPPKQIWRYPVTARFVF